MSIELTPQESCKTASSRQSLGGGGSISLAGSRQPSRESGGSNGGNANVVENYNYDMAGVHSPRGGSGRGQFRPPLQGISLLNDYSSQRHNFISVTV